VDVETCNGYGEPRCIPIHDVELSISHFRSQAKGGKVKRMSLERQNNCHGMRGEGKGKRQYRNCVRGVQRLEYKQTGNGHDERNPCANFCMISLGNWINCNMLESA
jgi:hypothetical protein